MKPLPSLSVTVLCVGKARDRLLAEVAGRHARRLARLASVTLRSVPAADGDGRSASEARAVEARRIRAALDGRSGGRRAVVALDERGRALGSRDLARELAALASGGTREAWFVIGGDDGLDGGILEGADMVLSLSPMTFTHEMARVILLEQLYRAHALLAGHPYHRAHDRAHDRD